MPEIDSTSAIAARALDGLFARQMAVAHNVANANSSGFSPIRVSFESSLQQALRAGAAPAELRRAPIGVQVAAGESVRIDLEITHSAENALRYATLVGALDRRMQILSLAINEGRNR
jgi:flagellar basal-body rod protein FlgB